MMKVFKRILAIELCLIMFLALLPIGALANENETPAEAPASDVGDISDPNADSLDENSEGAGDEGAGDEDADDQDAGDKDADGKDADDQGADDKDADDKDADDANADDKDADDKDADDANADDANGDDKDADDANADDKDADKKGTEGSSVEQDAVVLPKSSAQRSAGDGNDVQAATETTVAITGVSITPASPDAITVGDELTLTAGATVTPDGTDYSLAWESGNTDVATVGDDGKVEAKAAGTATITATASAEGAAESKSASVTITVNDAPPATDGGSTDGGDSKGGDDENNGGNVQFTVGVTPDSIQIGGEAQAATTDAPEGTLTWSSGDTAIATVSDAGVVTGVAAGATTITASVTTADGTTHTATGGVTVAEPAKKYAVIFYVLEGENSGYIPYGETQHIAEGELAVVPNDPQREGYRFAGWKPDTGAAITTDTAFYAEYVTLADAAINISYYNDVTGNTVDQPSRAVISVNEGGSGSVDLARDGYTLVGVDISDSAHISYSGTTLTYAYGANEIDGNQTVTVHYKPSDVTYHVRHFKETLTSGEYGSAADPVSHSGADIVVGRQITASAEKSYDGFTLVTSPITRTLTQDNENFDFYFERNTYFVQFVARGGEAVPSVACKYEGTVDSLPVTTRAGYSFAGWYLSDAEAAAAGSGNVASVTISSAANKVLYAGWTPKNDTKFTVYYWGQQADDPEKYDCYGQRDLTGTTDAAISLSGAEKPMDTTDLNNSAHFKSGYRTDGDTIIKGDGTSVINVRYDRKTYTLKFMIGSKKNWQTKATYANLRYDQRIYDKFEAESAASNGGTYIWSKSSSKGPYYASLEKMEANDMTLYGSTTGDKQTIEYALQSLTGEYVVADGRTIKTSGMVLTTEDFYPITGFTYKDYSPANGMTSNSWKTATIRYDRNTYKLYFCDYSNSVIATQEIKYQAPLTGNFTPESDGSAPAGFVFKNWASSVAREDSVDWDSATMPAKDVYVYAVWSPKTVTVYYTGEGVTTSSEVVALGAAPAKVPTPTQTGKTFVGWLDKNGNLYDTSANISATSSAVTADSSGKLALTLTASWKENKNITLKVVSASEDGTQLNAGNPAYTYSQTALTWGEATTVIAGDAFQDGNGDWWVPKALTATVVPNEQTPESDSVYVYTFVYEMNPSIPYTVRYLYKDTMTAAAPEKQVTVGKEDGTRYISVVETFVPVTNHYPDYYQQTKRLSAAGDNTITFLYTPYAKAAVTVKVYEQATAGGGYSLARTANLPEGAVGATASADPDSYRPEGFTYNGTLSNASVVISNSRPNVINLFYDRTSVTVTFTVAAGQAERGSIGGNRGGVYTGRYGAAFSAVVTDDPAGLPIAKKGYEFDSWTPAIPSGSMALSGDYTYAASFREKASEWHAVRYDANGATAGTVPVDSKRYIEGEDVTVLGNPGSLKKAEHTFAGWCLTSDGSGSVYGAGDRIAMGTTDLVLYAKWQPLGKVELSYNGNPMGGDTVTGSTAAETKTVDEATNKATFTVAANGFAYAGYTFTGWNTKQDGSGDGYAAGSTLTIAANTVLYAQWEKDNSKWYGVTYDANGGEGAVPTDANTYRAGDAFPVQPGTGLTREGYTFDGWNSAADGNGAGYEIGDGKGTMPEGGITLYAQWKPIAYKLTYMTRIGTDGTYALDRSTDYDCDAALPDYTAEKAGYEFDGWYADDAASTGWTKPATMPAHDVTVYGTFTAKPYTLRFLIVYGQNDTAPAIDAQTVACDSAITVPSDGAVTVKAGYMLDPNSGWYLAGNAAVPAVMPASDLTVYRNAIAIDYTVSYVLTADSALDEAALTQAGVTMPAGETGKHVNDSITVAAALGEVTGYTFNGWSVQSPATLSVSGGAFAMPADNVVFAGFYSKNEYPYTVRYFRNGEATPFDTANGTKSYLETVQYGTPDAPDKTPDGYKLVGTVPELVIYAGANVMNVYYEKDSFTYTVNYFRDDAAQPFDTVSGTRAFETVVTYGTDDAPDKAPTGYRLDSVDPNPLTVSATPANNVMNVRYVKDTFGYRVEYYYNNVLDGTKTATGTATFGDTVGTYTDQAIEGYKFDRTENLPLTITADAAKNVIKVYYAKDTFNYSVEYYYDNVKDDAKTETASALFESQIDAYTDKVIDGYKLDRTENLPLTITADATKNVISVYYGKDTFGYSVEYYYDGVLDGTATETASATFGQVIGSYTDKPRDGYKLAATPTPITITSNAANNVLRVQYVKDNFVYTVQYYYDGNLDRTKTESFTAAFSAQVTSYIDKARTGDRLDKVEGLPLTIVSDTAKNVISVYYVKDTFGYSVEYYYDNVKDDTKTETASALFESQVDAYTDKVIEGYKLDKTENLPLTITADATKNVIKVYYAKDTFNYSVEYYYDNVKDDTKTETASALFESQVDAYADKAIDGYKLDKTENLPLTITADATKNVISVYYAKDTFGYSVEYYYDGVLDGTKTVHAVPTLFQTVITAYDDKPLEGYKLEKTTGLPLTIASDAAKNVIKVYYVKDSFPYTVRYYRGTIDAANLLGTDTGNALFNEAIPYTDGKYLPANYVTPGAVSGQRTVTATAANNVLNVVYAMTAATYHLQIQYVYAATGAVISTTDMGYFAAGAYFGPVSSPDIAGYTFDRDYVDGFMPAYDWTEVVQYTAVAGLPDVPPVTPPDEPTVPPVTPPDEPVNPPTTPIESVLTTLINDEGIALAGPANGAWALLNLILTIATALANLLMLIGLLGKREEKLEDGSVYREVKKHVLVRILMLAPTAGAIIAFILTENMRLPMVLIDRWTVLMLIITAIQTLMALLGIKTSKEIDDEKTGGTPTATPGGMVAGGK